MISTKTTNMSYNMTEKVLINQYRMKWNRRQMKKSTKMIYQLLRVHISKKIKIKWKQDKLYQPIPELN